MYHVCRIYHVCPIYPIFSYNFKHILHILFTSYIYINQIKYIYIYI